MSTLTPIQQQVLTLLAGGSTVTAAAKQAGVHRNTVGNWRRSCVEFQQSFAVAKEEQEQRWREEVESLGALAISNLRDILECGPFSTALRGTGANLCMRTAIAVLDRIHKPATTLQVNAATTPIQPVLLPTEDDSAAAAQETAPCAQSNEPSKSDQYCTTREDRERRIADAERAEQEVFDAAQAKEQEKIAALGAKIEQALAASVQAPNQSHQNP